MPVCFMAGETSDTSKNKPTQSNIQQKWIITTKSNEKQRLSSISTLDFHIPFLPEQPLISPPLKQYNLSKRTIMLLRLGLCLEATSYIIAIFFVVSYVMSYLTQNEVFYKSDVDYVKRVTNLPAHTICPTIKSSFITKQLTRLRKPNNTEVIDFAKGLLRPKGKYCINCERKVIKSTFVKDLRVLADELTEPCENILLECTWNGEPFQCCRHFQRITTNAGTCFSLNTAHSKEPGLSPRDMTTSFHKPEAILILVVSSTVWVHVHDNKNLDFTPVPKIKKGGKGEISYKFMEWAEDTTAWSVPREVRNCTLAGEEDVVGFGVYSQSGCRQRCTAVEQYEKCGCKHHLLPGPERDCDLIGLICLDEMQALKRTVVPYVCKCLEECTKLDVSYVRYSIERSSGRTSTVVVTLSAPPTERLILTARITLLDVIVTLACISRLVTNKSVFRMVETYETSTLRAGFFALQQTGATFLPAPSVVSHSPPSSSSSHPIYRLNFGNCFSVC